MVEDVKTHQLQDTDRGTATLSGPGPRVRFNFRRAAVLSATALLMYAVFLVEDSAEPAFWHPIIDADEYDRMARGIASGEGALGEPYWHPPLYPYLLAGIYSLSGGSVIAAKVFQALMGTATCLLTWSLGRRLFGESVALLAAILVMCWGPLIFFSTQLLAAGLVVFLYLLLLRLLVWAADRHVWHRWLLCGVVMGLSAIALPNTLVLLGVLVAWLIVLGVRARTWRMPACAAVCVIATIAVIAPVTIRNYVVSGEFIPISYNGGMNFYIGNNPDSFSTIGIRPGPRWEQFRREPETNGITSRQAGDAYYYRKGLAYMREQPGDFVKGLLRKARLFFNGREIPRNIDMYVFRHYSSLLSALIWRWGPISCPFGLVAPLAALGLITGWRSNRRTWLLVAWAVVYSGSIVLFFVSSRHRLPIVPVLALLAACGVTWLWREVREGRIRSAGLGMVLVVLTGVFVNSPVKAPTDGVNFRAEVQHFLGVRAARFQELDIAEEHLRRAVELDPHNAAAHASLGDFLLAEREQPKAAIVHLRLAVEFDPDLASAHHSLGMIAMADQRWPDAAEHFRNALTILPVGHKTRYKLAVALTRQGRLAEAVEELRTGILLGATGPNYRRSLARLLFELGRFEQAQVECRTILDADPGDAPMHQLMGGVLGARDNWARATDHLRRAVALAPENAAFHLDLANALHQSHRDDEAAEVGNEALRLAESQGQVELAAKARRQLQLYQSSRPAR